MNEAIHKAMGLIKAKRAQALGIMEKKRETTMVYCGYIGYILGLYRDNGKENGNYYSILGLYLHQCFWQRPA